MTRLTLIIAVLFTALIANVPSTQAATVYNTQQSALYRAVDQLAWYGGMAEFDKLPISVQNAIRNIRKIGIDMGTWNKPYNGAVQQTKRLTIYLTTFNDTGNVMNSAFQTIPENHKHSLFVNISIIQAYGQSINMPFWN
jgi:hypothetical protein